MCIRDRFSRYGVILQILYFPSIFYAQNCSVRTAQILLEAAVKAGAPKDCILWIDKPSIDATKTLMNHRCV